MPGTTRSLPHLDGLDEVRAVCRRRPHPSRVPLGIRADDDAYRQAECDGFIQGLLWSFPALWVNDPGHDRTAHRKIVQLETASRAGFVIPETLITNDPVLARDSIESRPGTVVYKRTGTSRTEFAETRILGAADLDHLDGIRSASTTSRTSSMPGAICGWCGSTAWHGRCASIPRRAPGGWDSRLDTSVDFATLDFPPRSANRSPR